MSEESRFLSAEWNAKAPAEREELLLTELQKTIGARRAFFMPDKDTLENTLTEADWEKFSGMRGAENELTPEQIEFLRERGIINGFGDCC